LTSPRLGAGQQATQRVGRSRAGPAHVRKLFAAQKEDVDARGRRGSSRACQQERNSEHVDREKSGHDVCLYSNGKIGA
jgi:hypothetical protein